MEQDGSDITQDFNSMSFWTQIVITGGSGGSITILAPLSGNVDKTNKDFVFSSKPTVVVNDDASYREGFGWSWNSGTFTVTTDIAPQYDLYAIK